MRNFLRCLLISGLAAAAFIGGCSEQPMVPEQDSSNLAPLINDTPGSEYIDGSYIVVFKDDVQNVDVAIQEMADKAATAPTYRYSSAIKGFAGKMTEQRLQELRADPRVAYIEQDGIVRLSTIQTGATWGIDRVDQVSLPLSGTYEYNYTGAGVKAYIIDTGILYTHTEFGGRAIFGCDQVGTNGIDQNGHGTHVAGTVGGATYGIAKGVTLVGVRVLDANGSGTWSGVIAGVDWVTADHTAGQLAVANMSLGGAANTTLDNAVANSIADGVVYCIAAGNSKANAGNYSPARVAAAITVAATTSTDAFATSYSNYGSVVDILAPGSSIKSAYYTSTTATATLTGTSMASPHVAGACALYLQQYPSSTPAQVATGIVDAASANKITSVPTGTVNKLLYTLFSGGSTPTVPDAPALSSPSNGATSVAIPAALSWSASSGATSYAVQVATSSAFTTIVYSASGLTTTSASATGLSASTTYYWRVNATNSAGTSAWSSVRYFTTAASSGSAPAAPVLASPANGATNQAKTLTLTWNASTGATSYYVELSRYSTFSTLVGSATTTGLSVTASNLSGNTWYYWRVRASNDYGTSAWSSVWNFRTRR